MVSVKLQYDISPFVSDCTEDNTTYRMSCATVTGIAPYLTECVLFYCCKKTLCQAFKKKKWFKRDKLTI